MRLILSHPGKLLDQLCLDQARAGELAVKNINNNDTIDLLKRETASVGFHGLGDSVSSADKNLNLLRPISNEFDL